MTKTKRSRLGLLKENDIVCIECSEVCEYKIQYEKKDEGEEPIECDTCLKWYHRKCLDKAITKKDWESLTGDNQSITFKCTICIQGRGERTNELKEIKDMIKANQVLMENINKNIKDQVNKAVDSKLADVKTKHDQLETKITENEMKNEQRFLNIEKELQSREKQTPSAQNNEETQKKLESMITDIRESESCMENKIKNEVKMYLDTQGEKEQKKNNIIIHRLEESQDKEEDQKERDKADVLKIIATTNPELVAELQTHLLEDNKRIKRLGRKEKESTKTRPIRVILPDEETKFEILQSCHNLQDSVFSHISVQQDLTKEEQKKNYKLRQEVRERNKNGEDVCLFRGEIISKEDLPAKKQKK